MKINTCLLFLGLAIIQAGTSCTKETSGAQGTSPKAKGPNRLIQFHLYTEKDFSTNNDVITFSLFIRSHTRVFFDSTLSPMTMKDIPGITDKLTIARQVADDDGSDLAVGFRYAIENGGSSWFIDTSKAGALFKIVDFSFQ